MGDLDTERLHRLFSQETEARLAHLGQLVLELERAGREPRGY